MATDSDDAGADQQITFHYLKGPDFRSLHIDGAIGTVTPRGKVHIAFFSERPAIPKKMVSRLTAEGQLVELPEETVTIGGIVRQMEVDVFVDETVATELRDWLTARISELSQRREQLARNLPPNKTLQ